MAKIRLPFKGTIRKILKDFIPWYQNKYSARDFIGGTGYSLAGLMVWAMKTPVYYMRNTVLKTTTYSVALDDYRILCDGSTGAFQVNLPSAFGVIGRELEIVRTGATGTITVAAVAGETINGGASITLTTQWEQADLVSDGINWVRPL